MRRPFFLKGDLIMTFLRTPSPPTHNVSGFGVEVTIFSSMIGKIGPLNFDSSSSPLYIEQSVVHSDDLKFKITLTITPNSKSDYDLYRAGIIAIKDRERPQSSDSISLVIDYPDGSKATYSDGNILSFPSAPSIRYDGRLKPSIYKFEFNFISRTLPEKKRKGALK